MLLTPSTRKRPFLALFAAVCLTAASAFSQSQKSDSTDYSLEEMMQLNSSTEASALQEALNKKVNVSSKKALSLRETPGIVSVVSAEEIANAGARDLIDVLRMVPGFEFSMDADFQIGVGIRGNWAIEGKALLLLDGIEINETLYQNTQLGNRFPVDQIERIEIIRGPGSAIYGGTAEYGVVNIITKGTHMDGIALTGTYGQLENIYGRRNLGLQVGKKINHWHVDVSAFKGQGNRSDDEYPSFNGDGVDLADGYAMMDPTQINVGISYKNASLRTIYDYYQTSSVNYLIDHRFFITNFKYNYKVSKKLVLMPQLTYTNHLPWHFKEAFDEDDDYTYKVEGKRYKANVTGSYDITRKLNLIFGGEYFNDQATDKLDNENFGEGITKVSYQNYSLFAQGLLQHYLANVTFGARFDDHSAFGAAFVPRIALTKRIDNFHFKALYSQAYRAPGIENLNLDPMIKPERSQVVEIEAGYQFTPETLLTINGFHIKTKDVIVYKYDRQTGEEFYLNYERTGTSGIEMEYKIRKAWGYTNVGYSFYRASPKSTVDSYQIAGKEHLNISFPAHKLTLNSSFKVWKGMRINPSLVYRSARYAYTQIDENEDGILGRLAPNALANLFVNYEGLFVKGLHVGIGTYDLLDQGAVYPQAYDGGFAPLPGPGREFILKLSYQFSFQPQQ